MKKIFTLVCGLLGVVSAVDAATVDDIKVCKHSYVLVADDYTNNGTEKIGTGILFGDGFFFTPTGHDKATNKGSVDLSTADGTFVTEEIAAKYGEYGSHLNSLRLKTNQDVLAMKVTAGSKIIIFYEKNKDTDVRYPIIATDAKLTDKLSSDADIAVQGAFGNKQMGRLEWTANDDYTIYVGAENQIFISYLIVEANEAAGTPRVKVGPQTYDAAEQLWYREVTCTPVEVESQPTVCTYTIDGTAANASSTLYSQPIKCYQDMTVKFQAYYDPEGQELSEVYKCADADNEAAVSFNFSAPTLSVDGATFAIVNNTEGAQNYYSYGEVAEQQGDRATLTESATVTAYSKIVNGEYATFTTKSVSADVLVLNPIKADKTITVTGTAVEDEEATQASTTGTVYTTTNAALVGADKMDFFVKNLEFGVLADADAAKAAYQVPAGQEAYIKMNNTNITFIVADGDSVDVKVTCTKNSCKNIDTEQAKGVQSGQDTITTDHQCYVNLSGTNYGGEDLALNPAGNVIEFGLQGGTYTFQKYSGTGNILISSIEIKYVGAAAIETVAADDKKAAAKVVFHNGKFFISTAKGKVDLVGIQVK